MARSEARIFTTIWQDVQFLALSEGAQRLYLFLLSQPDLSHCGLIALRERRWARSAAGLTADRVTVALKELDAARFVVIDEDTEEVLIRSLIRRDQIWKQPNVMKSAREAAQLIESPHLRASLLEELRRIPAEEASELARRVLADFMGDLEKGSGDPLSNPSGNPSGMGSDEPSPGPSGPPSQGKGEGYGGKPQASPLPGIPSPLPPSAGTASPRSDDEATAGTLIAEWLERCRKRPPDQVIGQMGKQIKDLLAQKIQADDIRRGMALWMTKAKHPSTLPSFVNEAMNAQSAARASPHQPHSGAHIDPNATYSDDPKEVFGT